jgi:Domain of unknown function (DUF4185)/Helix-turn-helix domain of resolvase
MPNADAATLRRQILRRLRSGERVAAIAAETGVSRSTLYRLKREGARAATKAPVPARQRPMMASAPVSVPKVAQVDGKVADMTGPGITDRWGVTCADLGASVPAPNGKLVSVFGDTFSGNRVGEGDWRSPVALIGTGDADHQIRYEYAGGADPNYARQLWDYVHDDASTGWTHGGISTVIPPTCCGWDNRYTGTRSSTADSEM